MNDFNDGRDYLEREVDERASHRTAEEVRMTCSFARAERLLGREYHGRFLIELLQNAADASRNADISPGRSRVVVRVTEEPALLVANVGSPMSARVVIESLGHIGASTKAEGEAIGHKGIGFKSVLEITWTPEIYSGLQDENANLAVGFDPDVAKRKILASSDHWDRWLQGVHGIDGGDDYAAVPVLRFPHWIDELPPDVADLKNQGFDTVVRLPFDERFTAHTGLHREAWLSAVRRAADEVSDQILLLLGCFDEVCLEDRLAATTTSVTQELEEAPVEDGGGTRREVVRVLRNGRLSSKWRLFRSTLSKEANLAGELAVGIRVDDGTDVEKVLLAVDGQPSSPFHLYFPTRIHSGTPFLLHAYFEVDAARTGFYGGSAERNEAMLEGLAKLARFAVVDAVRTESLDLASLVNLMSKSGEPEVPLARTFREKLLGLLDDVRWIPLQPHDAVLRSELPANVFAERRGLIQKIGATFSPSYFRSQTELGFPSEDLDEGSLTLVRNRCPETPDLWEVMKRLCLPGSVPPWQDSAADSGFRALVDLFATIDVENHEATQSLLAELRGSPESRIVPVVGPDGTRTLLPVPDPEGSVRGRRGRLIMARVGSSGGYALVPPDLLEVAFLPDGLFSANGDSDRSGTEAIDRAKPLGIRPFAVDEVLDRLNIVQALQLDEVQARELAGFLWRLLVRARGSALGTRNSAEEATSFEPSKWFWCRPGSVWLDPSVRLRQQRERYLATVPLPCRDGRWRRAGSVAFGADWAEWLEDLGNGRSTQADHTRIAAYRALEAVCPGDPALLASPETVLQLLDETAFDGLRLRDPGEDEAESALDEETLQRERHAFLLRLGVWEVPPVEAFQNGTLADREDRRWPAPTVDGEGRPVEPEGGWRFQWKGSGHRNVLLAEDYRLLWPLGQMANRDAAALTECLRLGARLYGERTNCLVFCSGCSDGNHWHTSWRRSSRDDGNPSSLAIQLQDEAWVPCTVEGTRTESVRPSSSWWHPKPPAGQGLLQSPWRLVPLCAPDTGVDEELRRLAQIPFLEEASPSVVEGLLQHLKGRLESGDSVESPRTSSNMRQAFVGLHRIAYERLSELPEDAARGVVQRTGMLCEVGGELLYRPPAEARHDDGTFSAYVRHFVGQLPLAVISRDKGAVATRLGIPTFGLTLKRRAQDDGQDVTDDVREFLGDRIHELLAIMVHHSLGTQTLDAQSEEFERRARRIRNLQVRQVEDLVIDISVPDLNLSVTIGEGSQHDLFLEGETTASPVLYHDFSGDGWEDRLRRKISPHLARVLGNPAYTHTFGEFLSGDDAEREEFLLELGITRDEADVVQARVGVVSEEERRLHRRWFAAILDLANDAAVNLDSEVLTRLLSDDDRLSSERARQLAERGGGEVVRRDLQQDSALRILDEAGFDLRDLHERLLALGDSGLSIRVARERFSTWLRENELRLRVVLETRCSPEVAKRIVDGLRPPETLIYDLDPLPSELLSSVAQALRAEGFEVEPDRLTRNPAEELARLGRYESAEDLDAAVDRSFDAEERARFLAERASSWRKEIHFLAVLLKSTPHETRANIRELAESLDRELPSKLRTPSELRETVGRLFEPELAERIQGYLQDSPNASVPRRQVVVEWAGVSSEHLERIRRVLEAPRRERARRVHTDMQHLRESGVEPAVPRELQEVAPAQQPVPKSRKPVSAIKVDEGHDQRKRELGDEGERWALAAVMDVLLALDHDARNDALDDLRDLLQGQFEGAPVDRALGHLERARPRDLDPEELIEELSGLLHVSRHSDAFGFDLLGWLPPGPGLEAQAVCLEVKNSRGEGFLLSRGEWTLAKQFHERGIGSQYAVLVVRRRRSRGVPRSMDLLADPSALVNAGFLAQKASGYEIAYKSGKR